MQDNDNSTSGVNQFLCDIMFDMPSELLVAIQSFVCENFDGIINNGFAFNLVVDTNILFKAVAQKATDGTCFFEKIAKYPDLNLMAPPKIEEEIMAKIDTKFPKWNKTKNVDLDEAKKIASDLLQHITIVDHVDPDHMRDAMNRIGERDPKDTPFLCLSLQKNSHGIITEDKDFEDQHDVHSWNLKDVAYAVTRTNQDTLMIYLAASSLSILLAVVHAVFEIIWQTTLKAAHGIKLAGLASMDAFIKSTWWKKLLVLMILFLSVILLMRFAKKRGIGLFTIFSKLSLFLNNIASMQNLLKAQIKTLISNLEPIAYEISKIHEEAQTIKEAPSPDFRKKASHGTTR